MAVFLTEASVVENPELAYITTSKNKADVLTITGIKR